MLKVSKTSLLINTDALRLFQTLSLCVIYSIPFQHTDANFCGRASLAFKPPIIKIHHGQLRECKGILDLYKKNCHFDKIKRHFASGSREPIWNRSKVTIKFCRFSATMMMTIMAWMCLIEMNFPGQSHEKALRHICSVSRREQLYSRINRLRFQAHTQMKIFLFHVASDVINGRDSNAADRSGERPNKILCGRTSMLFKSPKELFISVLLNSALRKKERSSVASLTRLSFR